MMYLGGKAICASVLATVFSLSAPVLAQDRPLNPSDSLKNSHQTAKSSEILTRSVVLHWTAPGDDGNVGRATSYDMRYAPASRGPINTDYAWNQAVRAEGEPQPSMSGQQDSMRISGLLPGGRYYFCIKTSDEAGNTSALSNSPLITLDMPIDAFAIGDVNNSGDIDGLDIVFLVDALKGKRVIPMPDLRADVDGKCDINGLDVVVLRTYLNGGSDIRMSGCAQDSAQLAVRHLAISEK